MSDLLRVYASDDPCAVELVRSALTSAGIDARVLGGSLPMLAGGVPFMETVPFVCVTRDQAEAAQAVIATLQRQSPDAAAWVCPDCGEQIDGAFTECWQCAGDLPTEDA